MNILQDTISQDIIAVWIMAGVSIIFGLLACFMGYRTKKFWTGLVGCGCGFTAGYCCSGMFFDNSWICIGIGIFCALVLAVLAFCFHLAGIFLLCAVLMFSIILGLFQGVFSGNQWWAYLLAGFAGVAAGIAAIYFAKTMLIIVTGILGAVFVSFGVSAAMEQESLLLQIVLMLIFAAAGILAQLLTTKEKHENADLSKRESSIVEVQIQDSQEQKQRHERRRQRRRERS